MRLSALNGDLENTKQNLLVVRSPYEGVVISQATTKCRQRGAKRRRSFASSHEPMRNPARS